MDGEAQAPKGGRRVGGFLQLFDWNGKSRKKLFSSKSDVPGIICLEYPKQGKKSKGNFPTTRIRVLDKDEIEATTSYKGGSDYSCASSVTDEEGFGSKAPGVVARLMGLDSLPTSHAIEPYISPFFDTQSLDEAPFRRRGKFLDKAEGMRRRNTMEPKHPKSLSSAIEKFQTESLPPKSAKSIPITQHKLLSPIKNPCFVPSNDPAGIMEAATKIIDARPQAASSTARTRISSAGSSSVPLKTRELKEKVAASQRPFKVSSCSAGDTSASTKNKVKSVNLAIQAKVNVQRREGLNPRRDSMEGRQEDDASGPTRSNKIAHKKPSARSTASTVLRQNNRKQNCTVENAPSSKKVILGDSSHVRQRNSYKGGSKKSGLEGRDGHRDVSSHSGARSVPRKKRIIDGNLQDVRNDSSDSMMISQSYSATERRFPRVEDGREDGADIVSFTFTTPMTRSMGDPLSVLLEQKLRELTNGIGPSKCNFIQGEASDASCRQNSSTFFARSKTGRQQELHMDSMHDRMLSSLSSTEAEVPRHRYDLEGGEMDECSSTKLQTKQLHNRRYPSPVSILDSSDLNESCNSSDSTESNTTEECKEAYDSSSCSKLSTAWELDYIKDVLSNVELMFKDCASGRTHDIINPHLFDQLERKRGSSSSYKGTVLVEKKALFDCVSECLGWRCQRFVGGGFKAWEKGLAVMRRKEKLVEEVYIEIKGWSMMSCMVDEIVDKDMSIPHGRWLDFEADGFGIAVDVETRIFDDLVGEVVADVLAGGGFKGYGAFL